MVAVLVGLWAGPAQQSTDWQKQNNGRPLNGLPFFWTTATMIYDFRSAV